MSKLFTLNDWTLNKKISPDKRMAYATVYLKYPDWKVMAKLALADRKKFRGDFLKANFQKLLNTKYFDFYELVGTKNKPSGVKTKISLASLLKLARLLFIDSIHIKSLDGAKQKVDKPIENFFCIKMTVAIQVEGITSGIQECEDRFVLVKAATVENAYKKVQKQEKKYGEPYLNSDGRLVRWKIESYDDCYSTDITSINDLNHPEGIEVYSKLRGRKIIKERAWNGK